MIVIERQIQNVRPGKWAELNELDKKYTAAENRVGFPPKKRYRCLTGGHSLNTLIIERQWESFAALEAAYVKTMSDPEFQALSQEAAALIEGPQVELFTPLP